MTRQELEHAIRAACGVSGDDEVYVFGSQAILGQYPDASAPLRQSAEADTAPVTAVDMVDVIDAHLGELSPFHDAFGFYVHGVSIDAAVLPRGWRSGQSQCGTTTQGTIQDGCVEAHDLAVSKLIAFRDKDRAFVRILLADALINAETLRRRINQLPAHPRVTRPLLEAIKGWLDGVLKDVRSHRSRRPSR